MWLPHIFGTHKPLLTQTGFDLQLLETYKISLNNIVILYASKAINYRLFKDYFGMEVYFDILDIVELCRFRTANHKLPIEIGR